MEESNNSNWLIHQMKLFLRNVMLLFNVVLWLLVLYFSIHDDEKAALLSYVSVVLTILTVKYYFWEVINNSESVAYFIDCSSKTLVFVGVFLILLPKFWNTAFYSACLGIIMQTVKREIQVRARNEIFHLFMEVSGKDAKPEASETDEIQISENKRESLNGDEYRTFVILNEKSLLENITKQQNIQIKGCEENIKETPNFYQKLSKYHPDVAETMCDKEETVKPCRKENLDNDQQVSDIKKSLCNHNSERQTAPIEAVESTLKRMEYFTESNVISNYVDAEKIQNTEEMYNLQIQLLNLQEMKLSEYSKLESKFNLNENNIKRELKRNEENTNIPVKHVALNNKNLGDSLNDDAKRLVTADNSIETITKTTCKVKNEFCLKQENICSEVNPDNPEKCNQNNLSSPNVNNLFQISQSEDNCKINEEPVLLNKFLKDNENLLSFNNDSVMSDTSLQRKENSGKISSQKINKDSQGENSPESNENLNSEPRYESMKWTSMKTVNIQPGKETSESQVTCIHEKFNDEFKNLNARLQHKERIGKDCSTDFKTNREKNLMNKTNLPESYFETNKNLNSDVKLSNMNCTFVITTDTQSKNISEKKLSSQQINDGNLEKCSGKNDEMLPKSDYFKPKCLMKSEILDDSSKLNESADVEERTDTNDSVKKASEDEGTTPFPDASNVDNVVNRIDLSFIYALGYNVPCAEF